MALGYGGLLVYYVYHWRRLGEITLPFGSATGLPSVSVILAARNESAHMADCLKSLTQQDYQGDWQVIVIDDHSTDTTPDIARSFDFDRLTLLESGDWSGKKQALTAGVREASGDYLLFTDADVVVSSSWISTMVAGVQGGVLATGPVTYLAESGAFSNFQALDLFGLMVISGAGWNSGLHHLGNGANLIMTKDVFQEIDGYAGNEQLASGDDLFAIQQVHNKYPEHTTYIKNHDAIVNTYSEKTLGGFISQRLRWASKNRALPEQSIQYVWGFVWIVNLVIIAAAIWALYTREWTGMLPLVMKYLAEYLLLLTGSRFAHQRGPLRWYPVAFLINLLYVPFIGAMALVASSYQWKGRRVS